MSPAQREIVVPLRLELSDLLTKLRATADIFDEASIRIHEHLERTPEEWQEIADRVAADYERQHNEAAS